MIQVNKKLKWIRESLLTRLGIMCALVLLLSGSFMGSVSALTTQDVNCLGNNTCWYDPAISASCAGGNGAATAETGTGTLPKIIPDPYNSAFTKGGNTYKVAPALVAAIFTEENFTDTPTSGLAARWAAFPGQHPNPNSGWPTNQFNTEGAFQFIPSTWALYGVDGNGDGVKDPQNIWDAAAAAANYLAAGGATTNKPPASWQTAIFAYNHAQWYVDAVMMYYNYYNSGTSSTTAPTPTTTTDSCTQTTSAVTCTGGTATQAGLSQVRQEAVCEAESEYAKWQKGTMTAGFRASNPNSFSTYTQNRNELWCADFVSWVYHTIGYPILTPDWSVPAVETIYDTGKAGGRWTYHAISGYTPVPGDLAIHYEAGNALPYIHVNMVVSVSKGVPTLIGGDEVGPSFPDGSVVAEDNYTSDVIGYVSPTATGSTTTE